MTDEIMPPILLAIELPPLYFPAPRSHGRFEIRVEGLGLIPLLQDPCPVTVTRPIELLSPHYVDPGQESAYVRRGHDQQCSQKLDGQAIRG